MVPVLSRIREIVPIPAGTESPEERLFAEGPAGTADVSWLVPGLMYEFRPYSGQTGQLIARQSATGTPFDERAPQATEPTTATAGQAAPYLHVTPQRAALRPGAPAGF